MMLSYRSYSRHIASLVISTLVLFLSVMVSAVEAVDFVREVQPILSGYCYECHGADEKARESGLRLDVRTSAIKGGDSEEPAIVPGKPEKSALLARVHPKADQDLIMPPAKTGKRLSKSQVETLRRWIAEGAPYAKHWAFLSPRKSEHPASTHPIDHFVQKKLASSDLKPSARADAATLCRRIHLDVVGLPPSPQEVATFEAAFRRDANGAIDALIDKLQRSPHYGEKWARHWLDVARYADSNGFEKDLPREQWAWRDWVIKALNADMPYNQFVIEQLAGDLLPGATQDQIVATGFLRNSMINEEGAIIPEEFRMDEMFDRMDCLGKAVLGITLQCAQCHSHKFDPISQDEYYGLFAFFNNTFEAQSWVYSDAQQKQITDIHTAIRKAEDAWKKEHPDWATKLAAWQESVRDADRKTTWVPLKAIELGSTGGLNHPTQESELTILTKGHPTNSSGIYVIAEPDLQGVTGLRLEALPHQDLPFAGPGLSKYGTWVLSEVSVKAKRPGAKDWESVKLTGATADFSEPHKRMEPEYRNGKVDDERTVGPVAYLIDGDLKTGWRADRGPGLRNQESVAVLQFSKPLDYPEGTQLKVQWDMNHGGGHNRLSTMLGFCRVSLTQTPDPKAQPIDYAAIRAMRDEGPAESLFSAWLKTQKNAKQVNQQIAAQWKKFPSAETSVLRLAERNAPMARPTHLLARGSWMQPKHVVRRHTPAFLPQFETGGQPTRLDLARWMSDEKSPLTARVAVNRVWQAVFGTGLVETPEDFGTRSPVPAHPALLDWLAVDFMENGWSQKRLIKQILTSATYQQDSRATSQQLERDPKNQLLSRGPRFRLEAEVIRDTTLTIAGLLNRDVGGASIFPPVPESMLNYNYVRPTYWKPPTDAKRYRRALYVFRKRSMPDPVLTSFDAPNGDTACARRPRSNTPLSALVGLNETVFVEAAQALAQRILREGGPDDQTRADYAYRLCVGRGIRKSEETIVLKLLADNSRRLRSGDLKAGEIAFSALTDPLDLPPNATPNEIAAWTIVSRVLLNLDETLTKY